MNRTYSGIFRLNSWPRRGCNIRFAIISDSVRLFICQAKPSCQYDPAVAMWVLYGPSNAAPSRIWIRLR
jgi:hypothetical protein